MNDAADPAPDTAATLAARRDATAARDWNLSQNERFVRRPMPALDVVHERLLRNLRGGMFQMVRRSPDIEIEPVRVERFSEFLAALAAPVSYNVVSLQPLRGNALIVCDGSLISTLVDVLYGGAGNVRAEIEGRDFSPTEMRVIQRLIGVVCTEYGKAWSDIYPLALAHQRSETHAQFANVAAPAEMVVVTNLRIGVGGFEGLLQICLPYAALEPIRHVLYGAQQAQAVAEDRRWIMLLTREIQSVDVVLTAELGQAQLTVGELLAMKTGDFIPLQRPTRVVASIESTPVFACHYGTHNARHALVIEECLRGDEPHWLGDSHVQ